MSELELTELYGELLRNGRGLTSESSLMRTCENELVTLMRELDIMFRAKKNEWGREKATLELRINSQSREVSMQKDTIERKTSEVMKLRDDLKRAECGDKELLNEYQLQCDQLRNDVSTLKKQYDKMRHKHQKEKIKLGKEKLEQEQSRWSTDQRQLQSEVEKLTRQLKTLTEKCDLMDQQGVVYQDQLAKRKQMMGDIEASLRNELYQVKKQLHDYEDRDSERNVEMARLRADITHWKNKSQKIQQEHSTCQSQHKKTNSELERLQSENKSLQRELRKHETSLNVATLDQSGQQREISHLREKIREKDQTIQQLLDKNHLDESAALDILKKDLMSLDDRNRELSTKEKSWRMEINTLQTQVEDLNIKLKNTDVQCLDLRQQLHTRELELRQKEEQYIRDKETGLSKLQNEVEELKLHHRVEIQTLQKQLDTNKVQLLQAQRQKVMTPDSTLDDSSIHMTHADNNTSVMSKAAAELRLTKQQLEALRLENKHLQNQVVSSSSTNGDIKKATQYVEEIKITYEATINQLEFDNDRLRKEVLKTREDLQKAEDAHHKKYQRVLKEMQNDIAMREARLKEEMDHEKRSLHNTLDFESKNREAQYQLELDSLRLQNEKINAELQKTQDELDTVSTSKHDLEHEHSAMISFASSLSDIVTASDYNGQTGDETIRPDTTEFLSMARRSPSDPNRNLIDRFSPDPSHDQTSMSTRSSPERRRSPARHTPVTRHTPETRLSPETRHIPTLTRHSYSPVRQRDTVSPHHYKSTSPKPLSPQRDISRPISRSPPSKSPNSRKSPHKTSRPHSSQSNRASPKINETNRSSRSESRNHTSGSPVQSDYITSFSYIGPDTTNQSETRNSSSYSHDVSTRSDTSSPTSVTIEAFLEEQRKRTAALEERLNFHIKDMREGGQRVISESEKYLGKFK